jgi:hypothetical protein
MELKASEGRRLWGGFFLDALNGDCGVVTKF